MPDARVGLLFPQNKKLIAVSLPRVCRQIYAECGTVMYSQNAFGFRMSANIERWLSVRLPVQLLAVRRIYLRPHPMKDFKTYSGKGFDDFLSRILNLCPNLELVEKCNTSGSEASRILYQRHSAGSVRVFQGN